MIQATHLLQLARILLLMGAVSLFVGAARLANHAISLGFDPTHFIWIFPIGGALGVGKALLVMRPKMQGNALRLLAHKGKLYPWQIYPWTLLAFIASMILIMMILKQSFVSHPEVNAALAATDLAVGFALLIASRDQRPPKAC